MPKEENEIKIISKKTTGGLLVAGLIVILIASILSSQPLYFGLALTTILFLVILFLYNPLFGTALFLIIRTAVDKIGSKYSVDIGNNFVFNVNSLLGLVLIGLVFIFLISIRKKKLSNSFKLLIGAWILYLTIAFISIFFSIEKSVSIYELVRLASIFSIFILGFFIASTQKPTAIFKIFMWSSIIPLSIAFYQAITETGAGRIAGLQNRLYGTFSDPNSFASFVIIIIAVLLYFIISDNKKINFNKKWKEISLLSFLVLILIATFSRGGWLALLVFGSVLSAFKNPKILLFLFGGLILLTLAVKPVQERVEDVYNPPITSSVYWRFQQWDKMYRLFRKNPWTGYGVGTETIVHEKEFGFNAGNPYTHNDLLKNALETGIFGAISYTLLLLITSISLLVNYFKSQKPEIKNIFLIVFILFLAEIGFSMTSNILRSTVIQWIVWISIGSSLALNISPKKA